jgi:hypothetical protein
LFKLGYSIRVEKETRVGWEGEFGGTGEGGAQSEQAGGGKRRGNCGELDSQIDHVRFETFKAGL